MALPYLSAGDPHFKIRAKSLGFRLLDDYPALGLRNVLCLPARRKRYGAYSLRLYTIDVLGRFDVHAGKE